MTHLLERARQLASRPLVRNGRLTTVDAVLIGWFTLLTAGMIVRPIILGLKDPIGIDAVVYTHAARALLAGGNPWLTSAYDIAFAAPPPSLIPYLPLVALPDVVVGWLGLAVALVCAVYAIRRLRLPIWWLLFPPVALGIAAGSSALPMLALLVRGGVFSDAAAVAIRVYAALPLIGIGRWKGIAAAIAVMALTAPFLAWPTYIAERDHVAEVLTRQTSGGGSAMAIPLLVPLAVGFLLLLGRRRAAWLVVPALWPNAQLHYASIALPVIAELPIVAIALALPLSPIWVVAGLGGQAAVEQFTRRRRSAAPSPPDDSPPPPSAPAAG